MFEDWGDPTNASLDVQGGTWRGGPDATDPVAVEAMLAFRVMRFFQTLLSFFAVLWERKDVSESVSLEEVESLLEEPFMMSASTPGWDSSSMIRCGVLWYMYACDLS